MQPQLITSLRKSLESGLPGQEAQWAMAHVSRTVLPDFIRPDVKTAAVLILLYENNKRWHTVLIERKKIPGDRHSGQISFPGGKQEDEETLFETAVREAHEEIASPQDGVQPIGALTRLHIPVSNYMVYPFIGYLSKHRTFVRQETEVERVLEVPLTRLMDPASRQVTSVRLPNRIVLQDVPCFMVEGQVIWGATAMIISELHEILSRSKLLDYLR